MTHSILESPIGDILLTGDRHGLSGLYTAQHGKKPTDIGERVDSDFAEVRRQLDEYFAGERDMFDVVLSPVGTMFQRRVWEALRRIDYGSTVSYTQLANQIGNPKAVRAVGGANGRNPISIIVPCHRVVGADGKIVGYAGGFHAKRWLLDHEIAHLSR